MTRGLEDDDGKLQMNKTVVILCTINQLWQLCTAQGHDVAKQSYVKPQLIYVYVYTAIFVIWCTRINRQ